MALVNILGSCVSRDVFGLNEPSIHKVQHFLQSSTPLTWFIYNDKPKKLFTHDDIVSSEFEGCIKNSFFEKCVLCDYNKTVLDYYKNKSDYFLIDFSNITRFGLIKQIYSDDTVHFFSHSISVERKNNQGKCCLDMFMGEGGVKFEKISPKKLLTDESVKKTVDELCNWLVKKGYAQEQIILIDAKFINEYTDGFCIHNFDREEFYNWCNDWINKANFRFIENFSSCHFLTLPSETICDSRHKWGLMPLHYHQYVYEYLYDAVTAIEKFPQNDNIYIRYKKEYEDKLLAFKEQIQNNLG